MARIAKKRASVIHVPETSEHTIEKIISGGQTGADIAGLTAAKDLGFETGGFMPLNYMTADGPKPEYKKLFGCQEINVSGAFGYQQRTIFNIQASDATMIIAFDWSSPGTQLTQRECIRQKKPYILVPATRNMEIVSPKFPEVEKFLKTNKVQTLNIAGNRDQELYTLAYEYLKQILAPFLKKGN